MEDVNKFRSGLQEALRVYQEAKPAEMAARSGFSFEELGKKFVFTYLGMDHEIAHPSGEMKGPVAKNPDEGMRITRRKIMFLHYLTEARGVEPAGKWLSFREMRGNDAHWNEFRTEAVLPLTQAFGDNPASFAAIAPEFGGVSNGLGDAGFTFQPLPMIAVGIVVYGGDDEDPSAVNVIFDANNTQNLNPNDITFATQELAKLLLARAGAKA